LQEIENFQKNERDVVAPVIGRKIPKVAKTTNIDNQNS